MRTCGGSSGCIVGSSDTIQLVTKADVVVNEIAWTNNSSSRYAIERKWDTGQAHRFMTGKNSDSWETKIRLAHYGYVDELIECADGALVLNEVECPVPTPETPNLPALPIEITEVLPNPKGADEGNEFIELYNPNDEAVDLSQWRIYVNGDYDTAYAFAPGTTIEAGEYLVVKQNVVKFTLRIPWAVCDWNHQAEYMSWMCLRGTMPKTIWRGRSSMVCGNMPSQVLAKKIVRSRMVS